MSIKPIILVFLVIVVGITAALFDAPNYANPQISTLNEKKNEAGFDSIPDVPEVPNRPFELGLDLQGGMHLILKVDTSKVPLEARKDAPERALEVIRNRIDEFGVKEPIIHLQGENEIVVQLPGVTDRDRALDRMLTSRWTGFPVMLLILAAVIIATLPCKR